MIRRKRGFQFSGAHVVVTGASRGIGHALAREFAGRGSRVTLVARSERPLQVLADSIGGTAMRSDLSDVNEVRGLVARIEDAAGPIDMLFNGAAQLLIDRPRERASATDLVCGVMTNTYAPMELTRQLVPRMLARGTGTIVNVTSLASIVAVPTLSTYGGTKAAAGHFTSALQREMRRTPVRVVLVQFGQVETDLAADSHRRSPLLAAVADRIAKIGFMPELTPEQAASSVADGLACGRSTVVVPRRLAPLHHMREIPSLINDLVLIGLRP
jgi:uncharacterized protein